jgi:hypothetical protein
LEDDRVGVVNAVKARQKATAFLLCQNFLAQQFGMDAYVNDLQPLLLNHLSYPQDEEIRKNCAICLPELLKISNKVETLTSIWNTFLQCLPNESKGEIQEV